MAETTGIEWANSTWNPVRGCTRTTPGCGGANHRGGCYAEKIAARFSDPGQPFHGFAERTPYGGRWTGKLALIEDMLTVPMRWRKPRRIFVNSMSDLFHESLPDEAIDRVFAVMALCKRHTFQILTKRDERQKEYMLRLAAMVKSDDFFKTPIARATAAVSAAAGHPFPGITPFEWLDIIGRTRGFPLRNVWLGVSVEDRARLSRIESLRHTPAAIRFISFEPLLEDLGDLDLRGISWCIAGGESGPNARPMDLAWARSLRDQCKTSGVSFFMKQIDKRAIIPDDLMVREFPTCAEAEAIDAR
jgi:protein gp37